MMMMINLVISIEYIERWIKIWQWNERMRNDMSIMWYDYIVMMIYRICNQKINSDISNEYYYYYNYYFRFYLYFFGAYRKPKLYFLLIQKRTTRSFTFNARATSPTLILPLYTSYTYLNLSSFLI